MLGIKLTVQTPEGTLLVEVADEYRDEVEVLVSGGGRKATITKKDSWQLQLAEGQYKVKLIGGNDKLQLDDDQVIVHRGKQTVATITLKRTARPPVAVDDISSPFDALRREDIDPNELAVAGGGDPDKAPKELVGIFGDSRWLTGVGDKPWHVAYSPDGKTIASSGSVDTILWDVQTGWPRLRLAGDTRLTGAAAFHPNGERFFSADESGEVKAWDVETGRELKTFNVGRAVAHLAVSPDGKRIAICTRDDGSFGNVQFRDADTTARVDKPAIETGDVLRTAFGPRGQLLATGHSDGAVRVWRLADGESLHELKLDGAIRSICFHPDGDELAATPEASIWNLSTGERRFSLEGDLRWLAYSPDGETLATVHNDGAWVLWDTSTGETRAHDGGIGGAGGRGGGVAYGPDGKSIAAGCADGMIRIWSSEGTPLQMPSVHQAALTGFAVSPDGTMLVTTSVDGTAKIWDVATREVLHTLEPRSGELNSAAIDPAGRTLAVAGRGIHLYSLSQGLSLGSSDHGGGLALQFAPNGKTLAAASKTSVELHDARSGNRLREMDCSPGGAGLGFLAFTPDGGSLISMSREPVVHFLEPSTGAEQRRVELGGRWICDMALSPNGKLLAVKDTFSARCCLHDIDEGSVQQTFDIEGGTLSPMIAFSPDGTLFAGAGRDGVRVWPLGPSGSPRQFRLGRPIDSVRFAPEGRHLLALSSCGVVYVLRLDESRN